MIYATDDPQAIIKDFPKNFRNYLTDPKFTAACDRDKNLLLKCLLSFEDKIASNLEDTEPKLDISNFTNFLKTKIGGHSLSNAVITFFEDRMQALKNETEKTYFSTSVLFAIGVCANPTTELNLVKRASKAIENGTYKNINDYNSKNIEMLKKTVQSRLERGY